MEGIDPGAGPLLGDHPEISFMPAALVQEVHNMVDSQEEGPSFVLQTAARSIVTGSSGTCQGLFPTGKPQDEALLVPKVEVQRAWAGSA